ncbi:MULTISPECIES: TolC family protein [Prochlorococcus]|uniref:TolC family protein n=1 Tax=Prochlorococcus TaxID=1218 RepID=UPI00187C42BF|nr:TolC family protein [Prochlorococcus marinus]
MKKSLKIYLKIYLKIFLLSTFLGSQSYSSTNPEFLSNSFDKKDIKSYQFKRISKNNNVTKVSEKSQMDEISIKSLEFDDLINLIDENNLELKAEKIKLEQAQNNLSIVKSELKPSIQISTDGIPKYSIGKGDNPKKETSELKGSLSATVSYKLYDPEKSQNVILSENQLSKAKLEFNIFRDALISRAQKFFVELQLAYEKVEIAQKAFLLSGSSLDDAKILNKALLVSDIEVLEAESQLSRDMKFLNDKKNELELIINSLSEIIGVNKKDIRKFRYANSIIGFWEMDLDETIDFAKTKNKSLEKLNLDLKISHNKSNKELGKSKPKFSLVNRLSSNLNQGQSNVVPPVDFDETGSEYENTIAITAKWDIFNGGKNRYIREFKKSKYDEFNLRIKDEENKIKFKVSESYKTLKTSLKNILNTSSQVNNNKNILKISRLRFNAGVASQREIINNQRDLTQSRIVYANSIANYNKNLIDLKNITNLGSLKKCVINEELVAKSYTFEKEIDLSIACQIPFNKEGQFSYKTKEFKLYKNNINKIMNDKNSNFKSKDSDDKNIKKQPKEDLSNEEKVFSDRSDSYDSHESCEDIKNPQTQKNCFDSYL